MMQKVTKRKQVILDILDEQIEELEKALQKVQPRIDELAQLKRTRATLLSERTTTGAVGSRTQLTMEMVVNWFRQRNNKPAQPQDIADALGVPGATVRSHLNRGKDERYQNDARGWSLIGEDEEDEDDE